MINWLLIFSPHLIQAIIEKFKEKKLNVVTALREATVAVFPSTNLEAVGEDFIAALDNKNPQIKAETAGLISRVFCKWGLVRV